MSAILDPQRREIDSTESKVAKTRRDARGTDPVVLSEIYDEQTNIAVWKRALTPSLEDAVKEFLDSGLVGEITLTTGSENALSDICESLGEQSPLALRKDIAQLVEMYCVLFDVKRVGLRLRVLDSPMCPRFHTDKVPCRLICTYHGVGTEWLPHNLINRQHLGPRNHDKSDLECGLFQNQTDMQNTIKCHDW